MILWLGPRPVWTAQGAVGCDADSLGRMALDCTVQAEVQGSQPAWPLVCFSSRTFQSGNCWSWRCPGLSPTLSTSSSLTSHASKKVNLMVRILTLSFYRNNFFLALSSCGHWIRQRYKQSSLRPRGSSKRLLLKFSQCRWTITCWRWGALSSNFSLLLP